MACAPRRAPPASRRPPLLPLALAALWLPLAAGGPAPAVREVTVACAADVALPCTAPRDPRGSYSVSWAKLEKDGEERMEHRQGAPAHTQQQQESVEAPGESLYFLKIRNATGCDSGTYRCTLEERDGPRNRSGTVTLRVTGCPKEHREENFNKYRADIILLVVLVIFYLTLIIFTCFARHQSIFPDFSKPAVEQGFLPVTSTNKHQEPVTSFKVEPV
ncbi:CD83 antigen isoform X2 [Sorex araneus]|uniref:CD83 antigen isoform X2 n=1 Tax=Sorex araneus TaxID=42254 RepID=UPI00243404DE|nr:CD83 antigen isoform X2 [Sorex araneus]